MPSNLEDTLLFQIQAAGLEPPLTQYRFAAPRRFRFDLAYPAYMLACEIDGGTWVGGRHVTGAGFEADALKQCAAAIGGWRVLRVTTNMVRDGRALAIIEKALAELSQLPEVG